MLRVACLNNFFYPRGGAERVFLGELRLLQEKGLQMFPFSRALAENDYCPHQQYFPPAVAWRDVSWRQKVRAVWPTVYSSRVKSRFRTFLDYCRPQLIHAHNIYGGLTTAVLDVARDRRIPGIMTVHDYKLICPSYLMLNHGQVCERCRGGKFYHCLLSRCHKESLSASGVFTVESYFNRWFGKYDSLRFLLCPSVFLYRKLRENGVPESRLVHLPNYVDGTRISPSFTPGAYILFAGRLSREKGLCTLLQAVKTLSIPLYIVGTGPLEEELQAMVRRHDLRNVHLLGYKSGPDLEELFRRAAFVVVPSEWYENCPMTILEAFAYGKPVIASDMGGMPELIEPDATGMVFPAGNADRLRVCIEDLYGDRERIARMGRRARARVESDYSAQAHGTELLRVYARAVDGSGKAGTAYR